MATLSKTEVVSERYSRQVLFAGIGEAGAGAVAPASFCGGFEAPVV